MKTRNALVTAASVCGLFLTVQSGFAQGSLAPPGPPGPTMKSLDQVEPRTIVNAANTPGDGSANLFIISQPGSYYLTTNITGVNGQNGIEIAADNVTLDLNGFNLQGSLDYTSGIYVYNGYRNITVRNGSINRWGSAGVNIQNSSSANLVFERLNVSDCGSGIYVGAAGIVRDCNCQNNGTGIECDFGGIISGCSADNNDSIGIDIQNGGVVSGCNANGNGGIGFNVDVGTVSGCTADYNVLDGFDLSGSTMSGCNATQNGGQGIYSYAGAVSDCIVTYNTHSGIDVEGFGGAATGNNCIGNNLAYSTSYAGIYVYGSNNRIEDNHVSASGNAGIQVGNNAGYANNNIIIKNYVTGNGLQNYITPNTQIIGPLITTGGTISSSNPWANFSF